MSAGPVTYRIFGWFFPRALAAIYFIAFASWAWQAEALTGENGIMPVQKFLEGFGNYAKENDITAWAQVPTVYWLGYSDAMVQWLCWGACAAAVLVMAGVLQGPLLLALWFGYLSICTTGNVFLSFQWDILLLEAGFIAALISPWRLFVGRIRESTPAPSRAQMLLPQALILKLMFLSGLTKILAGDPNWLNFTALTYHYETQPIPTWVAWYVHHFPLWFHKVSCFVMFLVELGVPTLIPVAWILELIIPSWVRTLRVLKIGIAASFTGLMIITLLTGNYTFFNWLTILLALSMLDDGCWPAVMKRLLRWTETSPPRPMWRLAGEGVAVSLMLSLSLVVAIRDNAPSGGILSNTLYSKTHWLAPFRSINSYGLFRVMTTERNEIVIEVSDDGVYFQPLEFKWKPGRVDRPPPFVAPHQPRLDWQMWFAALHPGFIPQRDMQNASMIWFGKFLEQLLQHNEQVYALVEPPPFPIESIRAVRARFYRYEFTEAETRKETGEWWKATPRGDYSPTFTKR
ncbi:lipase maturation factor family protein [Roseimicrobium sp. ORNL1]|uniref:lipase maturation factor family protein n=1 Tax=Roseimicrobium sp. ORNL1 TaxID=2711231 RepID=UPI0013E12353|nr:lipase maturation factor family protein [Roseimicrobium sp. ORNL1]QIF04040.1 lipase maturation factor family protein [Roseimicrobium sp. ORNL1]